MKLSVIIVNYNVKHFLEQCLCSAIAAIKNLKAEIIVVDNASSDGSVAYLQSQFPEVKFIEEKENLGFAKANNNALQQASGEYILFLNPDTIVPEDAFEKSIRFFERHIDAGAIGVRMIDGSGIFLPESKRSFPSPSVSFYKLFGFSYLFPSSKIFAKYALGFLDEAQVHKVDVLSGAFMMVRRNVLDITQGFDEDFFMYGEDIDLSYRIQKAGYQNYYLGPITIVHFKGESTKRSTLNYVRLFYKAMRLFVKKHYHNAGASFMNKALQFAVFFRAIISVVAIPAKKRIIKNKAVSSVLLVGNAEDTVAAERFLLQFNPHIHTKTASFAEAAAVAKNVDEIVFCTGSGNYKKAIDLLQNIKGRASVKWHGANTQSIVGSNDKNRSGEVIAIEK